MPPCACPCARYSSVDWAWPALYWEGRWYPHGASHFGGKRSERSPPSSVTAGQQFQLNNYLRALALGMLIFSLLVISHRGALSGVRRAGLEVSHTLLSSRLLVGESGTKGSPPLTGAKRAVLCKKSHCSPVQSPSPWKRRLPPYRFH